VAVVENNKYSSAYIVRMKDLNYPFMYLEKVYDHSIDNEKYRFGFTMNMNNRPMAFSTARGAIRAEVWTIEDEEILDQFSSMIYKKTPNGSVKESAAPGSKDDLCVTTVIGIQIAKEITTKHTSEINVNDSLRRLLDDPDRNYSNGELALWGQFTKPKDDYCPW